METEQEIKELKENLKKVKINPLDLKWRIILLVLVICLIIGGYFL